MEQVLPLSELQIDPREFQTRDISEFTAEEYLAWVRYEAENCSQVVRANIDPNIYASKQTHYMPHVPEIPICSDSFQPDEMWIDSVLDSFSELRLLLARLSEDIRTRERKMVVPPLKQESLWFKLCLGENSHLRRDPDDLEVLNPDENDNEVDVDGDADGDVDADADADEGEGVDGRDTGDAKEPPSDELLAQKEVLLQEFAPQLKEFIPQTTRQIEETPIQYAVGVAPTTSLMLQFDQVLTQKLIGYHVKWLAKRVARIQLIYEIRHDELNLPIRDIILQWDCMISLHCKWIYSLLVRLETPLYQDAVADIREMYRTTCLARWNFEQFVTTLLRSSSTADRRVVKSSNQNSKDLGNGNNCHSKSCHSKGVVRFSGVFDDEDDDEIKTLESEQSINLEDLSLISNELLIRSEDYLASLNMIIVICGRYFGQEEEYETVSSGWSDTSNGEGDEEEEEEGEDSLHDDEDGEEEEEEDV